MEPWCPKKLQAGNLESPDVQPANWSVVPWVTSIAHLFDADPGRCRVPDHHCFPGGCEKPPHGVSRLAMGLGGWRVGRGHVPYDTEAHSSNFALQILKVIGFPIVEERKILRGISP